MLDVPSPDHDLPDAPVSLETERAALMEAAAGFGSWEWDLADTVTWSPMMELIYGFEPGEYPGTFDAFLERVYPDDREATVEAIRRLMEEDVPLDFEHRVELADGSIRWLNGRGQLIRDAAGRPVKMVGIGMDVTDRKLERERLAEMEARQRTLAGISGKLASSLDPREILQEFARTCVPVLSDVCAIGLFDERGRTIRFENAGVATSTRSYVDRIHLRRWREAPASPRTIGDAVAAGDRVLVADFHRAWIEACAPDDEQRDAAIVSGARSLLVTPLRSRGKTIGIATFAMLGHKRAFDDESAALLCEMASRASVAVDNADLVRSLRETADSLQRANAAKDEFLGLVSHELKTPITTIAGNAEILERHFDRIDPEERQQALTDIRTEGDRLHRIVDNLLVLARLEQGQEVHTEPTHLPRLVARVIEAIGGAHPGVRFAVTWTTEHELADASPDYTEQVLRNLLSNAVKYSPPGASIEIIADDDDGALALRILDRGAGIEEDEAGSLFEPFYRSARTAHQAKGVGIGLAVCKRLVEAQHGRLWARSREGGGSEFGFTLPLLVE